MISEQRSIQPELEATRQLLVRFIHAPSVKLTLQLRPASPTPPVARVLQLGKTVQAAQLRWPEVLSRR
jgi:hypothetical protein